MTLESTNNLYPFESAEAADAESPSGRSLPVYEVLRHSTYRNAIGHLAKGIMPGEYFDTAGTTFVVSEQLLKIRIWPDSGSAHRFGAETINKLKSRKGS